VRKPGDSAGFHPGFFRPHNLPLRIDLRTFLAAAKLDAPPHLA